MKTTKSTAVADRINRMHDEASLSRWKDVFISVVTDALPDNTIFHDAMIADLKQRLSTTSTDRERLPFEKCLEYLSHIKRYPA